MSELQRALQANQFVVTAEISPPKGTDLDEALAKAESLRGWAAAFNVTDQQSSTMTLGSLALCHLLKDCGLEPVFQATCRDRNRIALQSDLLCAAVLGIENVLCLTGDYMTLGDHPQAKPVFDLDSVTLLETARRLQEGKDLGGKGLQGAPKFFLGAVVNPGSNPIEPQIAKMKKKVRAGAQFFQTQAVFDLELLARFMGMVEPFGVPILMGIIPLKSAKMARFMNKNVAGIQVPEGLIQEMEEAEDKVAKGIEIAARLIWEAKELAQGVHIMALGWEEQIPSILEAAGLRKGEGNGGEDH